MTKLLLLLTLTASGAEPRKCANGAAPRLSGDVFAPVECSAAPAKAAELPGAPPAPSSAVSLKELAGAWAGSMTAGFGRYEVSAELDKPGWTGRTKGVLRLKELQFRQRSTHELKLVPAGKGRWKAEFSSDVLPGETLAGFASAGLSASTDVPKGARQLDLTFENGAAHRVVWTLAGGKLRLKAWSAVPGAPLRSFETELSAR